MAKHSEAIQGTEKEFLDEISKTLLFTKFLAGVGRLDGSYGMFNQQCG